MAWEPITLEALYDKILAAEEEMIGEISRFWELIQVFPEKWQQVSYGQEGNGFWVVAICGKQIIWYNDIEEGFNISDYDQYGQIKDYWCNQDDLRYPVQQLLSLIKIGEAACGGLAHLKRYSSSQPRKNAFKHCFYVSA